MISDKTIEEGAQYWCILKQPAVKQLIDSLITQFNDAQNALTNDSNVIAEAGKSKLAKPGTWEKGWKFFTKLMKSKPVKKGAGYTTVGAGAGGGAYLAGKGIGAGVDDLGSGVSSAIDNTGKGIGSGMFRAKNSGQSVEDLKDPEKRRIVDDFGVSWKDVGIAVLIGASLYALWKNRSMLTDRIS